MEPESNNFKDLYREEELRFHASQRGNDDIGSNLWRSLGFFKLLGQVVDTFIPKIIELIVAALGGDANKIGSDESHNRPPSLGPDSDPRNIKPSGPNADTPLRGPDRN